MTTNGRFSWFSCAQNQNFCLSVFCHLQQRRCCWWNSNSLDNFLNSNLFGRKNSNTFVSYNEKKEQAIYFQNLILPDLLFLDIYHKRSPWLWYLFTSSNEFKKSIPNKTCQLEKPAKYDITIHWHEKWCIRNMLHCIPLSQNISIFT